MNNKQIVIANQTLTLNPAQFGGAVTDKFTLTGVRAFVAAQAGLELEKGTKDNPAISFAEVRKLVVAKLQAEGKSEDDAKAIVAGWGKTYDKQRAQFKTVGKQMAALCVADPRVSITSKPVFGKHGFIGMNHSSRLDRSANATKVATLEAKIASLQAQLATAALPAKA